MKPKYELKAKKKFANATNIKALKNNADTRENLATSMRLNAVGWASVPTPTDYPDMDVLKVQLAVTKRGNQVTLGGINFLPVMGGVVVKDSADGFESLNIRVGHIRTGSPAHQAGVTSQHYLHKIRTVEKLSHGRHKYGPMTIVGSRKFRNTYTNTIKFEELNSSVDDILSRAHKDKKELEVMLVSYAR